MDKGAQNAPEPASGERCTRCLQPVASGMRRCGNCGHPVPRGAKSLTLLIGAGGVGALLFLVLLMWLVVRKEDQQNAPAPVDEPARVQQHEEILVETPKKKEPDSKPEKPDKQPPLNQ